LLHSQGKRKSQPKADLAPELETAEQRQVSVEKDLALTIRAARQERENAVQAGQIQNEDQRFELSRKRILFGAELMLTVAGFIALSALLIVNPALVPLGVSGGGGLGGLLLLLRRSAS
jgi:hypothetical protein